MTDLLSRHSFGPTSPASTRTKTTRSELPHPSQGLAGRLFLSHAIGYGKGQDFSWVKFE